MHKCHLRLRFGRNLVLRLGHRGKTRSHHFEGLSSVGESHFVKQIACCYGARSPHSSPTVDVDVASRFLPFINLMEQSVHCLYIGGNTHIFDRKAIVGGIGGQERFIGTQFAFFGEVHKMTHTKAI